MRDHFRGKADELVVPMNRTKLVAIALGAAVFVFIGVWMLLLSREEGVVMAALGLSSVAFFGLCGAYAISRLVWPVPAVVINQKGIVDNASALGVGFMRWDEIADLQEYRFKNQIFLGIVPRNLDALLAKQSAWKRSAIKANLALGAAPVNIPQIILPLKVSELLREIDSRFRHSIITMLFVVFGTAAGLAQLAAPTQRAVDAYRSAAGSAEAGRSERQARDRVVNRDGISASEA